MNIFPTQMSETSNISASRMRWMHLKTPHSQRTKSEEDCLTLNLPMLCRWYAVIIASITVQEDGVNCIAVYSMITHFAVTAREERGESVGKYIVELKKNETLYKAATRESDGTAYVCSAIGTPYTEPDMEQVRKEAYDKGYDDATAEIGSDEQAIAEKAYQKGLSDAWECARKVTQVRKYGGYGDCLEEVFGHHRVPWDVFDYSVSEAIEKIRQYEQEEQFHVGDEFENENGKRFVILKMNGAEIDRYIDKEGKMYCMVVKYKVMRKTGRHFPEIAEVLAKMKES